MVKTDVDFGKVGSGLGRDFFAPRPGRAELPSNHARARYYQLLASILGFVVLVTQHPSPMSSMPQRDTERGVTESAYCLLL